uniref:Uncharacterized protein n=1 Tax=Arundo donax TaxID=35708 RepID=A0A0A9ABH6_ARUDO
MALHLTRVTTP